MSQPTGDVEASHTSSSNEAETWASWFGKVFHELRDRNFVASARLNRRCGQAGAFLCRGRVQLTLPPAAHVFAPRVRPCALGLPLLGRGTPTNFVTVLSLKPGSRLDLSGVLIGRGSRLTVESNARLAIGEQTFVADGSWIGSSQEIEIGRRCAISWNVTIIDGGDHHRPPAPIRIEDHVWIGCNAIILRGVTIGADSIVGAGAVVTRSCPPRSVLAGVPARVIKQAEPWT